MNRQAALWVAVALMCPPALQAEIYESTDGEGHRVFSDQPAPGAEEVTLPESNVADPVAPAPAPDPAATGSAERAEPGKPTVIYVPDAHSDEVESQFRSGERHEVREAQPRHEVLEAEQRHEVR